MPSTDSQQAAPKGAMGKKDLQPTVWSYLACYGLFAVILAACYVNFWAWERVVKTMILAWLRGSMATEAFYAFSMVAVGSVLFLVAIVSEHLLRTSVPRGRLAATFRRIGVRLVASALLAVALVTVIDVLFVR